MYKEPRERKAGKGVPGLGERLQDLLNDHSETLSECYKKTGIGTSTLSDITNDLRDPGGKTIVKLCQHFNVSADYLLGLSPVQSPNETLQAIGNYTGLSQEAMNQLHMNNMLAQIVGSDLNHDEALLRSFINYLIENSDTLLKVAQHTERQHKYKSLTPVEIDIDGYIDEFWPSDYFKNLSISIITALLDGFIPTIQPNNGKGNNSHE